MRQHILISNSLPVPDAIKLCKQRGLDAQLFSDIYPKCYYGDAHILALENLVVAKGYEIVGLEEKHDLEVAKYKIV